MLDENQSDFYHWKYSIFLRLEYAGTHRFTSKYTCTEEINIIPSSGKSYSF